MTPDEVIEQLKKLGVEISRPTLSRYEKQGLIPNPERGSLGRAGGRWTDYPDNTVEEAFVAWKLMHGDYGDDSIREIFGGKMPVLNPATVSLMREIYYLETIELKRIAKIAERSLLSDGRRDIAIFSEVNFGRPRNLIKEKVGEYNWDFLQGFKSLWRAEIEKVRKISR